MNSFIKYDLHEDLIKSIANLKFKIPTLIQDKVIPKILSSKMDIIATAQTGTGKTASFGLPLIHLTNNKTKGIVVIILCPTRELCIQITKDLNSYSKYINDYKVVSIYGGSKVDIQLKALKENPKIISEFQDKSKIAIQKNTWFHRVEIFKNKFEEILSIKS